MLYFDVYVKQEPHCAALVDDEIVIQKRLMKIFGK